MFQAIYPNPFDAEVELVSSFVTSVSFMILLAFAAKKALEKRSRLSVYLLFLVACYTVIFTSHAIGYVGWALEQTHKNDVYRVGLALSMSFLQISTVALLLFSNEMFPPKKWDLKHKAGLAAYIVFSAIIAVLLLDIPGNNYGEYNGINEDPPRRILCQGATMISSMTLFLYMLVKFWKMKARVTAPSDKKAVSFIVYSYVAQVFTLVFLLLEMISQATFLKGQPSLFIVFMHGATVVAVIFLYLGFLARHGEQPVDNTPGGKTPGQVIVPPSQPKA